MSFDFSVPTWFAGAGAAIFVYLQPVSMFLSSYLPSFLTLGVDAAIGAVVGAIASKFIASSPTTMVEKERFLLTSFVAEAVAVLFNVYSPLPLPFFPVWAPLVALLVNHYILKFYLIK